MLAHLKPQSCSFVCVWTDCIYRLNSLNSLCCQWGICRLANLIVLPVRHISPHESHCVASKAYIASQVSLCSQWGIYRLTSLIVLPVRHISPHESHCVASEAFSSWTWNMFLKSVVLLGICSCKFKNIKVVELLSCSLPFSSLLWTFFQFNSYLICSCSDLLYSLFLLNCDCVTPRGVVDGLLV